MWKRRTKNILEFKWYEQILEFLYMSNQLCIDIRKSLMTKQTYDELLDDWLDKRYDLDESDFLDINSIEVIFMHSEEVISILVQNP